MVSLAVIWCVVSQDARAVRLLSPAISQYCRQILKEVGLGRVNSCAGVKLVTAGIGCGACVSADFLCCVAAWVDVVMEERRGKRMREKCMTDVLYL